MTTAKSWVSRVRKEQSRRVNGNKRARLTRPLHLAARCVSLVEHTSFADHSIRRSRMLWRDVNAWQKQAGNRISVSCRIRACVYTRLCVSYSRNAAKDIRNGSQHLSEMRKVESIKARIYMRERTRKGGEERSRCIIESQVLIEFRAWAGRSWALA